MEQFCLQCDDGTPLELGASDLVIRYRGQSSVVPAVYGWHCPKCGECEFVDQENSNRVWQAIERFRAEVDAGEQLNIRAMRKRLGLTQARAAELFGGGVNAFSEYERGKTRPHKSTVSLLRLLNNHPELLAELNEEAA